MSRKILDMFSSELAPFWTSTTTLHFSSEHPIPAPLITRIVRARVEENEQRAAERKKYKK